MSLAFLAFIQTLLVLTFGLNFELHWSSELVENLEEVEAERLLRIGLAVGLPLAGMIFTSWMKTIIAQLVNHPVKG